MRLLEVGRLSAVLLRRGGECVAVCGTERSEGILGLALLRLRRRRQLGLRLCVQRAQGVDVRGGDRVQQGSMLCRVSVTQALEILCRLERRGRKLCLQLQVALQGVELSRVGAVGCLEIRRVGSGESSKGLGMPRRCLLAHGRKVSRMALCQRCLARRAIAGAL